MWLRIGSGNVNPEIAMAPIEASVIKYLIPNAIILQDDDEPPPRPGGVPMRLRSEHFCSDPAGR